jgi:hypothetical protein
MYLENGIEMATGIIACAFGQQSTNRAGPSNEAIGSVALQVKKLTDGLISTQWEVEAYLQSVGESADHLTSAFGTESHYVTTEQVFTSSFSYFESVGDVSDIVVVAQPIHLRVIRLVMKDWETNPDVSFVRTYDPLMHHIPFDNSEGNVQDWTRGPIRFGAYLVRAKLLGVHGN